MTGARAGGLRGSGITLSQRTSAGSSITKLGNKKRTVLDTVAEDSFASNEYVD
ncbi:hypothetical protein HDU99_004754, partial [Rhizoclosmatium hyalinum]